MSADSDWIENRTGRPWTDFDVDCPKGVFESELEVASFDKKEVEIAAIVEEAPLRQWLNNNSYEALYNGLWQKSKGFGCRIENLRENPALVATTSA